MRHQDGGKCQQKQFKDGCAKNSKPFVNSQSLQAKNRAGKAKQAVASASLRRIMAAGEVESKDENLRECRTDDSKRFGRHCAPTIGEEDNA